MMKEIVNYLFCKLPDYPGWFDKQTPLYRDQTWQRKTLQKLCKECPIKHTGMFFFLRFF